MLTLNSFLNRLQQPGVEFYTRHQEDEWGLRYLGNGQYQYWLRNYQTGQDEQKIIDEQELKNLLAPHSLGTLESRFINVKNPPNDERFKTLEQLLGSDWEKFDFESELINKIKACGKIPLRNLSIEQLRLLIGQSLALDIIIPIALEILDKNILVEGDLYPGDLLLKVLQISPSYWQNHSQQHHQLQQLFEKHSLEINTSVVKKELYTAFQKLQSLN